MNSKQYEELCRFFLSDKLNRSVDQILSIHIQNPKRPGLPKYKHQIDLCWESEDDLNLYLNIANAKWRSTEKVEQREVLLLQQVKEEVAAHKAMMITNIGFTSGAVAVAKDKGIALHIVKPNFDYSTLSEKDSQVIQSEIQSIANINNESIYHFSSIHKAFEFNEISPQKLKPQNNKPPKIAKPVTGYSTKIVRNATTKSGGSSVTNRSLGSSGRITKGGFSGFTKDGGSSKTK